MNQLYFVESIISNPDTEGVDVILEEVGNSNQQMGENNQVFLNQYGQNDALNNSIGENAYNCEFRRIILPQFPVLENTNRRLEESHYVYFDESNGAFTSGKDAPLAISRRRLNSRLRRAIIKYSSAQLNSQNALISNRVFTEHAEVHSYHVNVGHGNCTFLLIQENGLYELWVVDCGEHDYLENQHYSSNIDECLRDISKTLKIKVSDIKISRLLITHWHYDHISGIKNLIDKGFIDANTIVFANIHYGFSSKCANTLLAKIKEKKIVCYEPTVALTSFLNIKILYTECRIRRQPDVKRPGYRMVRNINDSSVVFSIEIAGRRMILPGDLEKDGWDHMTKLGKCCPSLQKCDFYCISHHGSITGHINRPCVCNSVNDILSCCKKECSVAIIMGRAGAYNGIFCPTVINDFASRIFYSEKDSSGRNVRGFVLDWSNITFRYI